MTLNRTKQWQTLHVLDFDVFSFSQDLDQTAKDIITLSTDIRVYSILKPFTEFEPSFKFEDDFAPTDAITAIRLYFNDYVTFDVQDLHNLLLIQ
jgi:hypothetical protein